MKITLTNLYRTVRKFLGALANYAALPLTHYSQSTLSGADSAARAKRRTHVAAARATRVAVAEQKNQRAAAIAFARICRITLMPALGESWNSAWIPAGWKRQTLSVPKAIDDLIELFEDLQHRAIPLATTTTICGQFHRFLLTIE